MIIFVPTFPGFLFFSFKKQYLRWLQIIHQKHFHELLLYNYSQKNNSKLDFVHPRKLESFFTNWKNRKLENQRNYLLV